MMKKIHYILYVFLFVVYSIQAQETGQSSVFVGNATGDYQSESGTLKIQVQVGGIVIGSSKPSVKQFRASIGFPYNILYISPTFVASGFQVSKGYYGDKINITWQLGANEEIIDRIEIFRKKLGDKDDVRIGIVAKDVFEYNDTQVEGSVLYEYRVKAIGIPGNDELYTTYITGIGFRNATATVSGSITYEGGNPVQDVLVYSESSGAENAGATNSITFNEGKNAGFAVQNVTNLPADEVTLQAWIALSDRSFQPFSLKTLNKGGYRFFIRKSDNDIRLYIDPPTEGENESEFRFSYHLEDSSIPTGELDAAGNDILKKIDSLAADEFIHFSVTIEKGKPVGIFINGREINEAYATKINANSSTGNLITINATQNEDSYHDIESTVDFNQLRTYNAGNNTVVVDELRVWNRVLSEEDIRRDYRRYLSGSENGLVIYLRMDEREGRFLYDLSKDGFMQNNNHAELTGNAKFTDTVPTSQQLGVFGVTDPNGSYIISSIPYKGTGESFVVTPSLGVHEFQPASQTLFLGAEASVVNQLDFTDVSSFKFNGKVAYNVVGVFNAIDKQELDPVYTQIRDFGYNKYKAFNGTSDVVLNKGQYQYVNREINPENNYYINGTFNKYPVIGVEDANVYIDGNIVINENNQPVKTDKEGKFTVSVPIGNHKIEVKKQGHTFALSGVFPAVNTFEFFEDQIEERWFIDTTRISLLGRVVGGKVESEKPLGFGLDGAFVYTNNADTENQENETISSINNIGVASIKFKGDVNSANLDVDVSTKTDTGEYEVSLIPYLYTVSAADLKIPENTDITILTSNETLNLLTVPELDSVKHITKDKIELYSKVFHHKKSFRYNAPVTLEYVEQEYEKEIKIDDILYDISGLDNPLYLQKEKYDITFEVSQSYTNFDDKTQDPESRKEYVTDGVFNITNNLEVPGKSTIVLNNEKTLYTYTFKANIPNTTYSDGFLSSISVQYSTPGSNPLNISNAGFKSNGIIKGGAGAAGTAFASVSPERPDIILRDPPGSNSFASIESGTTISFTEEFSNTESETGEGTLVTSVGVDVSTSLGVGLSVETEVEVTSDLTETVSLSRESTDSESTSVAYTFNQTISTSDEPDFVGADGDLYIGNAKNVYYGLINNIFVSKDALLTNNGTPLEGIQVNARTKEGNEPVTLYISTGTSVAIAEQQSETFFFYSQKFLLETLIPELDGLAANFEPTPPPPTPAGEIAPPVMTATDYTEQANIWKRVIQENERTKFLAKTGFSAAKERAKIQVLISNLNPSKKLSLLSLINASNTNISFDSGLGELTKSVTTTDIVGYSEERVVDITAGLEEELGGSVNGVGGSLAYKVEGSSIEGSTANSETETNTTISYTLKDTDEFNVLNLDVVDMFDGNGPIFITKAGATSCPYEAGVESKFYKTTEYDKDVVGEGGELLSAATNKVYFPEIKVEKNTLTNIPESEGAVFILKLKNKSENLKDLEYVVKVDQLTLNGATTNVSANGVNVYIPYNETIEFPFIVSKPSNLSNFEYPNIRVYLKAPCDDINSSEGFVDVSVQFKKSCSKVALSAPQDNFVFNRAIGYSKDGDGVITNNTLDITFTDFNTDFAGFKQIHLQYRNASSSAWSTLRTYYGTEKLKTDAGGGGADVVIDSDASEYTFNFNVIENELPDGNYEFKAISVCTDDIENSSSIVSGTINLNAPVMFGTPKPSDGILDVGEDISLRFNEAVSKGTTTDIKVTGLSNQQDIDHSVSVLLDGGQNQIELPNQILPDGSLTLQFWYKNATIGSGTLISQENGIKATLNGNELTFSIGNTSVTTATDINSTQYNFYSLVYQSGSEPQLIILENGVALKIKTLSSNLDINSSKSIFIGGSNIIGNIHDVRLWSKPFTPAQATVAKDKTLTGKELNLLGYWSLDEGNGKVGVDKAKSRNAIVNLGWAIKPKGTAYTFANNEYLSLENVGFVQPTAGEDITLSFWIKTANAAAGTIFSNGRGNIDDPVQSQELRNKWSVNMKADGNLELMSENISYNLTTTNVADDNWHHVALVVKRGGSINAYIDATETSSVSSANVGGISGNKILIGARLYTDGLSNVSIDNYFTGKLDELRLWNTARSFEQIKRDRYFEMDPKTAGLMLYTDFNQEDDNTTKGPKYNHLAINNTVIRTFSSLSGGAQHYALLDSPALKPKLKFTNIPFSTVINGDQMIIQPELTTEEWSLFEGQILNFSVSRMIDEHFNQQLSPITWSAFVNRQEIEWFTEEQTKEIVAEKNVNEAYSFIMNIVNKGGSSQPYTISGLPTWITASSLAASVAPNSTNQLIFTVDKELAMGTYNADIFLETASGYNDRLTLSLRVLTAGPDWSVNAPDYGYSMNIIGKIKINGNLSRDQYTKIGAFVNDIPIGEAYLEYDTAFSSYFLFLTAYSNVANGESITFKIWDAINGQVLTATSRLLEEEEESKPNITFEDNEILGSKSNYIIFSGGQFAEQTIALNKGWTWTSFFVEDDNFTDINKVFTGSTFQTDDLIKTRINKVIGQDSNGDVIITQTERIAQYFETSWGGSLYIKETPNLKNTNMYRVKLANSTSLRLTGNTVNEANLDIAIADGWNHLAFPIHRNISLTEALAYYDPTEGDVIKDQYTFAIYDSKSGWSGSLKYMQSNRGYMMESGKEQIFNYPNSQNAAKSMSPQGQEHSAETIALFANYNSNMSVVAEIVSDVIYETVLVYDSEGVLRGQSPIVSLGDKQMSFVSAFSNTNEILKFYVSNGSKEVDVNQNFLFENNKIFGDMKSPVVINLKSLATDDVFLNKVVLYPNPFSESITINASQQDEKVTKIELFNTIGALLKTVSTDKQITTIDTSNLAKGVYLIKLSAPNGKFTIKKLVKK